MIGQSLRQYVITAQLGQGGMGQVWKARDTSLEREVALKVLPTQYIDDLERKDRLVREAKSASALNHPNIVTIYEINSDQGIDFIAMEYVAGETLAKVIHRGALAVEAAIRLGLQVAEGVGRAHRAGIVHRDLKPGNIMVTGEGLVKVLDFGLAKWWGPAKAPQANDVTRLASTQIGTTVGTVGYMSPEQAIGDVVDARSDVFSFGVVLYQMLTGELPFAAETQVEMLRKLHLEEPPPLASFRPEVPPVVQAIVAKALAKKPSDRYESCMDIAAALRAVTGGTAPHDSMMETAFQTGTTSRRARFPEFSGRRRWLPSRAAIAVLALTLVAGAGFALWRLNGAGRLTDSTPTDGVSDPTELSRQAAAFLARYDKEGNVDRAIGNLERALSADPRYATAHAYLSEAYIRKRGTNPDPQFLNLAREAARRAVELGPDLAAAHLASGRVALEGGARDEATRAYRRAADLDPANGMPHVGLAMILAAERRDEEAERELKRGVELGGDGIVPRMELGQFYFTRARYAEALDAWEGVRRLTPDNVIVLRNLSAAYYFLGRHDEAASSLQRALEVRPSGPIYTNLGTIRFFQGRYHDAVAAFEKAVELSPNSYLYWGNLGDGYRWAPGRRGEAAAAYRRASDLLKPQIAQKPQDSDLRSRHALYLIKMGDVKAALNEIESVAPRSDLSAQMRYRLAVVYELAADRGRSLAAIEGALKAGYPLSEVQNEPELLTLRTDARYHRLVDRLTRPKSSP